MVDLNSIKKDVKAELRPRKLARTVLVPQFKGIANPIKDVFGIFVTVIGQLFVQSGLLTKTHPAMTGEISGFGAIWQMIIDASANLKFKRENFYQIAVFYAIVGMLVFGVLGAITFMLHLGVGKAHAQTSSAMFTDSGIAMGWLNNMFAGTSGLGAVLGPMLALYNAGILALATFVALWSFISMVMDSAHHGEVGGKRHSELWAPIRLVFALGMLVPVSNGFNSIQLVTVALAHAGSGLGTTVWNQFYSSLSPTGNPGAVVSTDELNELVGNMLVIADCVEAANAFGGTGTASSSGPISASTNGMVTSFQENYNLPNQTAGCGSINASAVDPSASSGSSNAWITVLTNFYNNTIDPIAKKVSCQDDARQTACHNNQTQVVLDWAATTSALQQQITAEANNLSANSQTAQPTDSNGWADAGAIFITLAKKASDNAKKQSRNFSTALPDHDLLPTGMNGIVGEAGCLSDAIQFKTPSFACGSSAAALVKKSLGRMYSDIQSWQSSAGLDASPAGQPAGGTGNPVKWLLSRLISPITNVTTYLQATYSSTAASQTPDFGTVIFNLITLGDFFFIADAAVFALAIVAGVSAGGFSIGLGAVLFLVTIGSILFTLGLLFAVYIPLMPAIRFLFGIITWLITVFEALVAMPIVMLVHS